MKQGFLPVTSWHLSIFRALLLSWHPSLGRLRYMKCLKWPILYREVRKYSPAAVTIATGWEVETTYLVRNRANWTFRDTSSCCSPETAGRTKDAHTSSRSNPPYNCTYHSYTGHDLPRKSHNQTCHDASPSSIRWRWIHLFGHLFIIGFLIKGTLFVKYMTEKRRLLCPCPIF